MIRELNINEYDKILNLGKVLKENFNINKISQNEKIFIYETDKVLAFIQILSLYETLEIINIVVDESARRLGVGTSLIEYAIKLFKPEHVLLEVRSTNEQAIKFYEKLNFKKIRVIKNYYNTEDGIVMERAIL